jgi:hypothetical protein
MIAVSWFLNLVSLFVKFWLLEWLQQTNFILFKLCNFIIFTSVWVAALSMIQKLILFCFKKFFHHFIQNQRIMVIVRVPTWCTYSNVSPFDYLILMLFKTILVTANTAVTSLSQDRYGNFSDAILKEKIIFAFFYCLTLQKINCFALIFIWVNQKRYPVLRGLIL